MIKESKRVSYDPASNKIWVYNSRLCNELNKILYRYLDGNKPYCFQTGEEAMFKLPPNQTQLIAKVIETFETKYPVG